jgi:hypothetical protein
MATNRASLSDSYLTTRPAPARRSTAVTNADTPRRTAMVVGGFVLALVSLAIGSIALVQVWLAPAAADGKAAAAGLQSWEALALILVGGLGFAAGAALIGIGMGRWTAPQPPVSEDDYTGPGNSSDMPDPPRIV